MDPQGNRRLAVRSSLLSGGTGGETLFPWFVSLGRCGPAVPLLRDFPWGGLLEGVLRRGGMGTKVRGQMGFGRCFRSGT